MKKIGWVLSIGLLAMHVNADVLTVFDGGGSDVSSTTVTWSGFDGAVTATAASTGNPSVAVGTNTVSESGVTGVLTMGVTALGSLDTLGTSTPFDPLTWTGGSDANGEIHTLSSGWGVDDIVGNDGLNGNMQPGEALILTFNTGGLNLSAEQSVVWTGAGLAQAGARLYKYNTVSGGGDLIGSGADWAGNVTISDGDAFALVNINTSAMRLNSMTMDVIPEPATLGLITAFGGGILFIRRRFMM